MKSGRGGESLGEILRPLIGEVVTEASMTGMGGNWINVEVGGSSIWTDMAAWTLASESEFLLACEDTLDEIRAKIGILEGRRLTNVDVSAFLDLTLDFDGIMFVFFTTSACSDETHWSVQLATGDTVFAGPGSSWRLDRTP